LCRVVREWDGPDANNGNMLCKAALHGHLDVIREIREWGPKYYDNWILGMGAQGGHIDICHYARSIGADDFRLMLFLAIEGGHEECRSLARSWLVEASNK
jgi:hypothetical protein